jgi:Uma2 family endonuclease
MVKGMSMLTLELRPREEQTAFNLKRWNEVLADRQWHKIEGRVETDRHGRITIIPPLSVQHGQLEAEVGIRLSQLMQNGKTLVVCPVSTVDGVRTIDVAWASVKRWHELGDLPFFLHAPEICVEIISAHDSREEVREKIALWFEAGAREVWTCTMKGDMLFFTPGPTLANRSQICPDFPRQIEDE